MSFYAAISRLFCHFINALVAAFINGKVPQHPWVLICILNPQSRKDATTHGIFWQLCTYCALKLLDKKGTADETELCFALFLGPSIMDRERGKASSSSSSSLKNTIEWLQYLSVQPTKYIPRPMLENQNFNITVKLYLREPGKDYLIAPFDPFLNAHFMRWTPLFSTGSTYVHTSLLLSLDRLGDHTALLRESVARTFADRRCLRAKFPVIFQDLPYQHQKVVAPSNILKIIIK